MSAGASSGNAAKAIACAVGGAAVLTLNDTAIKFLAADLPISQILVLRGLNMALPIAAIVWWQGGLASLRVRKPGGQALRAALFVASTYLFLSSLKYLPLADSIALTFAGPLFTMLLAIAILGERVGWRRWVAALVGFAGVVLIVRPTGAFRWEALMPLGSAAMIGLADVMTRRLSASETSVSILAVSTTAVALSGFATLGYGWVTPSGTQLAILAVCGLLLATSLFLTIESFRLAEATVVSPFRYTALVWAVLFGYLAFGDVPDASVLGGGGLVIASGLYIWHRETRAQRATR